MLSDRQKLILKAIIEDYVITNEPVGSKALTEKPYLDYSSATIRYDMQALEESGYLEKTHTSSGRVPSQVGYRYYVDHLIIRDENVSEYFKYVDEIFDNKNLSKEDALKRITEFISELTGYYSIILGSSADFAKVMKMEIVPLSKNEAVMLIVTNTGAVQSQKISIPDGYNQDDLLKIIKKDNEGLKAWQKMLLLLIFSGAIAYYGYLNLSRSIIIPFIGKEVPLNILYIPFVIIVYAATTNAVNLTDGLDGLAAGTASISSLALLFISIFWSD